MFPIAILQAASVSETEVPGLDRGCTQSATTMGPLGPLFI